MRQLLKLVLLVALNAKDRTTAIKAVQHEIQQSPAEFAWVKDEKIHVIEAFASRHEPIRKHFFSGSGLRLQRLDSDIAEWVINHFTAKKIPVLCIHDSFVVSPEHRDELREMMEAALAETARRIGIRCDITPKLKELTQKTQSNT